MSLLDLPIAALAVIVLGMFSGSLVKGVLGAGIPAVGLPIMVMVIDPAQAVPLFLVPVALSNIWQIWEAGEMREALRRYWSFTLMLMICVWIGAGALVSVDPKLIALCVGILVICTTLIQIFSPDVSEFLGRIRGLHPVAGGAIGLVAGVTGMFTPMIVYFAALRPPKDLFVTQMAIGAMLGSIPLFVRLAVEGHLTWDQAEGSALALIPAAAGLAVGFWIRKRISETVFRHLVQAGLLAVSCGLIWRGLS
ncbi:MAG: hypothetical protein CMM61_06460 [Rhodospirillaceae bacterium]|nr:hypothetical protein [Rhodospirillaceae bacterium]